MRLSPKWQGRHGAAILVDKVDRVDTHYVATRRSPSCLLTQKPLIYFKGTKKPGGYERTFPQAMNMYLKASPYRMNIFEFLASCPDVPEDSGPGWDYSHVKPEEKLPASDTTGDYVHPFYKDMYPDHWRARRNPSEYSYEVVDHETDQVLFTGSYQKAVEYFTNASPEPRETFRETISVTVLYIRQYNEGISGK